MMPAPVNLNQTQVEWWIPRPKAKVPKPGKRLAKMQSLLGWPDDRPLPETFTVYPDMNHRIGTKHAHERRIVLVRDLEPILLDGRHTVIDLFAGCGGFSLGFVNAGWRVVAMVENNYWATSTYCFNIPTYQEAKLHVYKMDIHQLNGHAILQRLGLDEIDCIIGSPPCQSFSSCGKRKVGDPRDLLLWEFGRLIKEIQPQTWLMENVPGIVSKTLPNGEFVLDAWADYMGIDKDLIPPATRKRKKKR